MEFLAVGVFFTVVSLYWLFTVRALKKLSRQFPETCLPGGMAEDSSMVDILHGVMPAGYRYSINLRISKEQLCLIPTGLWGWISPISIPFDQLMVVEYKEGLFPLIQLGLRGRQTSIFVKGDGARIIKNIAT